MKRDYHKPVLLAEVVKYLDLHNGAVVVDATLGGGGHAEAILDRLGSSGILIGIDKDKEALDAARHRLENFSRQTILVNDDFRNLAKVLDHLKLAHIDAILLDLGVSSAQLDEAERGFSYNMDALLDMRMDQDSGLSAAEVIAKYPESELTRIFRDYGEERWASRVAQFVVATRIRQPILTTGDLVDVIKKAIPAGARRTGGHPARRIFQALRIEVNDELGALSQTISDGVKYMAPGARFVVISYHSLEDRIVKEAFRDLSKTCVCPSSAPRCTCARIKHYEVVTRKPVVPTQEEVRANPRSRSAKLRCLKKIGEPD